MLEVRALRAGYGGVEVLRGLDMQVDAGEIVAVLGANGVGKTTLNKVLSGVLPCWSGEIRFDGTRIDHASAERIVAAGLIQVPEGRRIFPNLSVRENLELGSYRRGKPHRRANLERVLDTFPRLRERTTQRAGTLSGGEQQMLAIGRGLMAEPLLLILDEPSLGLSPLLVEEMFALIARLNAGGLPVLLVEQNVVQSLELAARAYILENGVYALTGSAAAIRDNPDLKRAYLGM
ncbi:MAG: ABC transporter ATP-binding protein [Rhodospirillales bacterium]|nr:ABC transporter ATP-binding protein [Rhodospirillales bacterium]